MFPQTSAEDLEKALKSNLTIDFAIDELSSCSVESAGKSGKSCLLFHALRMHEYQRWSC